MNPHAMNTRVTVIPTLRYRDAKAAIEWLCRTFGFEKHAVYEGEGGRIDHAQLTFGNGMVMLGSDSDDAFGESVRAPQAAGGKLTHGLYVVVADPAAHFAAAKAAGAEIVTELHTADYGGDHYACRDPEGYLWGFGSYDPWAGHNG